MLAGQTTVNLQQRTAIYGEAQAVVWQGAPWIFLWSQNFYVVTSSRLDGVSIVPTEKWAAIYAHGNRRGSPLPQGIFLSVVPPRVRPASAYPESRDSEKVLGLTMY